MQERHAPLQLYYLFKSFVIMFMIQAVIVLFTPLGLTAAIWYQILAVNVVVGIALGWLLYKQWYHIEFSFDDLGFKLGKGKAAPVSHTWREFSSVSLAKNEYGEFVLRLHGADAPFEIPASKLKLNPFRFRSDVMKLVAVSRAP